MTKKVKVKPIEKKFELRLPSQSIDQFVPLDILETKEGIEGLKSMFKQNIEQQFKYWLESGFDDFFDEQFQQNLEKWQIEENYSFSDRLIHKIP